MFLFRHRGRVELRAGARVLAFVLFASAVVSIIDPDVPQWAAETVGVARGTDLLLYLLVVVYVLTTLGLYFRVREGDQRLRRLARDMALERAEREEAPGPASPGRTAPRWSTTGSTRPLRHESHVTGGRRLVASTGSPVARSTCVDRLIPGRARRGATELRVGRRLLRLAVRMGSM